MIDFQFLFQFSELICLFLFSVDTKLPVQSFGIFCKFLIENSPIFLISHGCTHHSSAGKRTNCILFIVFTPSSEKLLRNEKIFSYELKRDSILVVYDAPEYSLDIYPGDLPIMQNWRVGGGGRWGGGRGGSGGGGGVGGERRGGYPFNITVQAYVPTKIYEYFFCYTIKKYF
jgi:hypothetical protein